MKVSVIKIGNSRGIRVPKSVIDQCGVESEVEFEVGNNQVIIKHIKHPRSNWEEEFKAMAENGDDMYISFPETKWDEEEW